MSTSSILHTRRLLKTTSGPSSFQLVQNDLITLFESIEPADQNLSTYSFRIHELLMRTCMELEANFKAILAANTYSKTSNLNITDYYKVNASHYLSEYEVQFPYWTGVRSAWKPFEAWRVPANPVTLHVLPWYQAYNAGSTIGLRNSLKPTSKTSSMP
jgi:hypothetical protein